MLRLLFILALLLPLPTLAQVSLQAGRPATSGDITTVLGFTPIQQCGGINQACNKLKFGWDGSDLRLTVDVSDIGKIASQSWVNAMFKPLSAAPGSSTVTMTKNVFIGGTGARFYTLADPVANAQMLANGHIGVYEHANGMASLTSAQRSAIWQTWAKTGIGANGAGQAVGEVGGFTPVPPGYTAYFGGQYPNEVVMNIITGSGDGSGTYTAVSTDAKPGTIYKGYFTATDLTTIETAITAANAAGAGNVAVVLTPNGGGEDLDDPFATSPAWANARAAALFGGGIALDVPPSYWVARGAQYQQFITQMVAWGVSKHIRVAEIVSPYAVSADAAGNTGNQGFDPYFAANTQLLYSSQSSVGSFPTQWIVENYGNPGSTGNDVQTDTTPNSLNAVALYLAGLTPQTPGLTPAGSNNVADFGLLGNLPQKSDVVGALGFTPVQQGTGVGQRNDTIALGWDGGNLRVTVDVSDLGPLVFQNQSFTTPALTLSTCPTSATGLPHGGLWCDSSNIVHRAP